MENIKVKRSILFQISYFRKSEVKKLRVIREIRQRRRKERQNPKPGKLQRFFHAVLSVITFECCRRETIPKVTAPGEFFVLPTSFQSTRSYMMETELEMSSQMQRLVLLS